jgi:nucleoid-associated protein YgaU
MSVATEFAPDVYIPERARASAVPGRLATVTVLHRPDERTVAPPLRLTRRGVLVLGAAVALLALALVGFAWASAPSGASGAEPSRVPDAVTVHAGDTLWSIAAQVAPQRDPRAEVGDLQKLNGLSGVALVPGQVLRTH